ncbi:hypothetical protein OG625_38145 [Streptomyces sp. NBC_01351]|uniref:hypothetical protein n=1 Tax=Streptomyces sp. NBC_01351 TaxID=2903833 RepID=UPI002E2F77B0|nr:hypothetical protein [Streptomyces sp. NBC_01351]
MNVWPVTGCASPGSTSRIRTFFEANLVNPGGLDELLALGLPDRAPHILGDLLAQTVTEPAGVTA